MHALTSCKSCKAELLQSSSSGNITNNCKVKSDSYLAVKLTVFYSFRGKLVFSLDLQQHVQEVNVDVNA